MIKDIYEESRIVGQIEYVYMNPTTIAIHEICIFTPFRNNGYGRKAVSKLFINAVDTLIGLGADGSHQFWRNIGAEMSDFVNKGTDKYFTIHKRLFK